MSLVYISGGVPPVRSSPSSSWQFLFAMDVEKVPFVNLLVLVVAVLFLCPSTTFSFDSCDPKIPLKCVDTAIYDRYSSFRDIIQNKTAVNIICRRLHTSVSCIEKFAARCSKDKDTSQYDPIINTTKNMINNICRYHQNIDESVPHRCMEKYSSLFLQKCSIPFKNRLKESATMSTDKGLESVCTAFEDFKLCIRDVLLEYCGKETFSSVQESIFKPLDNIPELQYCINNGEKGLEGFRFFHCSTKQVGVILKNCHSSLQKATEKAWFSGNPNDETKACRSFEKFKVCVRDVLLKGCSAYDNDLIHEKVFNVVKKDRILSKCSNKPSSASILSIPGLHVTLIFIIVYSFLVR